jgi:hypothetical protein
MSQQIKKKFLGGDQIGSEQILIEKDASLRGTKQDSSVVDLIKLNSTDEVLLKGIKILNSSNLIPADVLPSYVDDVLEFADLTAIEAVNPGEVGKIYVALDTNKCYRWSGSTYIQITSGAVDSVNGSTGVVVLESSDINLSSPVNSQTTVQGSLEDLEGRIDDLEIGGGDTKEVKISANDTTPGYIEDKIVGAANKISISTLNDGADEDLQITIGSDVFDKSIDTTDNITEGSSNLYFTDTRAKTAAVSDSAYGVGWDGSIDIAPSQNAVYDALVDISSDVTDHVNNPTGAHAATAISFSNGYLNSNISAIEVQAAIEELDSEKVAKAGDTMSGQLDIDQGTGVTSTLSSEAIIFTDAAGQQVYQILHGSGLEASFTDNTSITVTANYYEGALELGATSLDQSAADGAIIVDALNGYQQSKTDYVNQFTSTAAVEAGSVVFNFQDQASGLTSDASFQHNAINIQVNDGSGVAIFNATVGSPVSNTGFDGLAIAPTQDAHLTSKKYVDDEAALKVDKAGDTMTGTLIINPASGNALEAGDIEISENAGLGLAIIQTASDSSKQLVLQTGDKASGVASPGAGLYSGNTISANSGYVQVSSGQASTSGNSGQAVLTSGPAPAGTSGVAQVKSGNGLSSSPVQIISGNASSGNSGNILLSTGTATGTRGVVNINAPQMSFQSLGKITNLLDGTSAQDAVTKSQLDNGLALKLNLSGGTMSGNIAMGNNSITNLVMTSDAHSAATRAYVDTVAEGLHVHAPVRLLANVDLGGTYNNGVDGVGAHIDFSSPIASIDGVTSFSVGDRIILAFQNGNAADLENGIYFIEDSADIDSLTGDILKLTRAVDFNTPAEMAGGDFVFVQDGSQYADTGWVMTETVVNVGITPVKFLQFSGAGSYTAGDGLDLNGTVFSVNVSEIAGSGLEDDTNNNLRLTDTTVVAASYGSTAAKAVSFTVDAQGRLSAASEQDISIVSTQVSDFQSAVRAEISVADTDSIDLSYSSGQVSADLKLDPVNSALGVGPSGLSLQNTTVVAASYGSTAAKAVSFTVDAQGRLSAASEQDISIVSTQMSDFQSAVRAELSAGDGLDYNSSTGEFSVDLKSAGGLKIDATELAVEPADFAGHGLEDDGSDNLAIKKEFVTVPDISVSANGLSIVNRWGKESYVVIAADTVLASDYYDLDHEIEANSLVAFVDRLAIHEGIDYNLSVVSGVTRVTFIGDLVGPGQSQLSAGDRLTFTYQKKAKA